MSTALESTVREVSTGNGKLTVSPSQSFSPTICLLALSTIADDPRVRRQGDIFHRSGWRVIGVGLPGGALATAGMADHCRGPTFGRNCTRSTSSSAEQTATGCPPVASRRNGELFPSQAALASTGIERLALV